VAGPRVRIVAHPKALLARLARDHTDEGGTIVGIRAVPIALIGAVSFTLAWMRCRRVCRCVRDSPSSRARRAVGSPLAMPRSRSTIVAGRCRVFAKTVPVKRV
jgi:hypothetical protein